MDQPNFEAIADLLESEGPEVRYLPVIPGEMTEEDHADFRALYAGTAKPILAPYKTGVRAKMLWEGLQD